MQELLNSFGIGFINFNEDWRRNYINVYNTMTVITKTGEFIYYDKAKNITLRYNHVRRITDKSGYNSIDLCMHEGSYFVIRSTKNTGFDYQLDSFIENIKTIYLYSWQKHNYPEFKIFPEVYSFSYNKENKKYYLVMEYIPETFSPDILGKITDIMQHLSQIKFRHGDLTKNNILVKEGSPIFIDFGFSSFCINDIWFDCDKDTNVVINYRYKYPGGIPVINNWYNIMHDFIILTYSLKDDTGIPEDMKILGIPINSIKSALKKYICVYLGTPDENKIKDVLYFNEPGNLNLVKDIHIFEYILPPDVIRLLF